MSSPWVDLQPHGRTPVLSFLMLLRQARVFSASGSGRSGATRTQSLAHRRLLCIKGQKRSAVHPNSPKTLSLTRMQYCGQSTDVRHISIGSKCALRTPLLRAVLTPMQNPQPNRRPEVSPPHTHILWTNAPELLNFSAGPRGRSDGRGRECVRTVVWAWACAYGLSNWQRNGWLTPLGV